jgi:16S rRNA (cytosine967-C5)-methyltransferase
VAEQAEVYPELLLGPLETGGLDGRDAALAHAIYDQVIRRWLTLAHVLGLFLKQPMSAVEPRLVGVLLSGGAQLLFFDRIPAHAALNESVELAKRLGRPGAAGMVNAVLRRVLELVRGHEARPHDWAERRDLLPLADGRVLLLNGEVLPADPLECLAVSTSHPPGMLRRWLAIHPRKQAQELPLHSLVAPPTVCNTAHASGPLPELLVPHTAPGHHVFTGNRTELLALLESRPDLWVQDPASSRAVAGAGELSPRIVIDLCAGQGTKTRQLAAMFPGAKIIATDVDPKRSATLAELFRGSTQVEVMAAEQIRARATAQADLVLLDVPCSNTGVLARRSEARYRTGKQQLDRLVSIQREIMTIAVPLLARAGAGRGRLLYSTCSLEREENEFQADWASREFGLTVQRHERTLPAGLPGDEPASYRDGSYFALLG